MERGRNTRLAAMETLGTYILDCGMGSAIRFPPQLLPHLAAAPVQAKSCHRRPSPDMIALPWPSNTEGQRNLQTLHNTPLCTWFRTALGWVPHATLFNAAAMCSPHARAPRTPLSLSHGNLKGHPRTSARHETSTFSTSLQATRHHADDTRFGARQASSRHHQPIALVRSVSKHLCWNRHLGTLHSLATCRHVSNIQPHPRTRLYKPHETHHGDQNADHGPHQPIPPCHVGSQ